MKKESNLGLGDTSHLDKCLETCKKAFDNLMSDDSPNQGYYASISVFVVLIGSVARNFFPVVNEDEFKFFVDKILKHFDVITSSVSDTEDED